MSLTVGQKHDLLLQFNQHREETFEQYLKEKHQRVAEEEKSGTKKAKGDSEYTKLYKKLGPDSKNKDLRRQLQEEIDMYTDNQLSTSLN